MAEKVQLQTEITGLDQGAKSLQDLKKELKDAKAAIGGLKEGTEEYVAALKKIGDTKDSIDDLNDSINATTGAGKFAAISTIGTKIASGFQAAQGAMALFGTKSEEVEKALLKVQAASAFAEGLKGLEGIGDALKNAKGAAIDLLKQTGLLTVAQRLYNFVASLNPIGLLITAVGALAAGFAIYKLRLTETKTEAEKLKEATDKLVAANNAAIEVNKLLITEYEGIIGKEGEVFAAKKKNFELEIESQKAILKQKLSVLESDKQTLENISQRNKAEQALAKVLQFSLGIEEKSSEEISKDLKETGEALKRLNQTQAEFHNFTLKADQDKKKADDDARKKAQEAAKKDEEERLKKLDLELEEIKRKREAREQEEKNIQLEADKLKANDEERLIAIQDNANREITIQENLEAAKIQASLDAYEKEKEVNEKRAQSKRELINAIKGSEEALFSIGNSIAELAFKDQKKRAEFEKKAAALKLAIDTAKGISSVVADASKYGFPLAIPIIAGGVAMVLANIAKAKQLLQSAGGDVGSMGGNISSASGNIGSFNQSALANSPQNTSTLLNQNGTVQNQPPVLKTYVVETEVTDMQKKIKKIENKNQIE